MSDRATSGTSGRLPAPVPIIPGTAGRPPGGEHDRRGSEASFSVRARVRASLHERRLGSRLELALDGVGYVLHHRIVDHGSDPVDHLVVGPTGIWPVRAVHADGRVKFDRANSEIRISAGSDEHLVSVGAVDSPTVSSIERRLAGIGYDWAPVKPAVCLTQASIRRDRRLAGVLVTTPRRLVPSLLGRGQLGPSDVQTIAAVLDSRFPPADEA